MVRVETDAEGGAKSRQSCSAILTTAHVALARRLIVEKETLPGAVSLFSARQVGERHTPLHHWTDDELAELQSEALAEKARAERAWLEEQHANSLGCSARTKETFITAVDAVRTFGLPCSGSLVLAPATALLERSVPRGAMPSIDTTGDLVITSDGSGRLAVCAGYLLL